MTEVQYFWGPDLSGTLDGAGGVGGLLAVSRDGRFYFPVYDNNGNVMKYVDESGDVVALYVYDDFGSVISQSGSLANVLSFGFSTKYRDREISLLAYQFRSYSARFSIWTSRDPIGENGGDNLHAFCLNDPIGRYDSLGMKTWSAVKKSKCSASSIDKAAKKVLLLAVKMTQGYNPRLEHYGNLCCKCVNGRSEVFNTGPFEGDVVNGVPRSNPNDPRIACPRGTTKVGYYHTHLDGVNFSENDMYSLGPTTYPYYMAQNKNEIKKAIPMRTDNPKVSGDPHSARGTLIAPPEIISLKLKNSSLELEE